MVTPKYKAGDILFDGYQLHVIRHINLEHCVYVCYGEKSDRYHYIDISCQDSLVCKNYMKSPLYRKLTGKEPLNIPSEAQIGSTFKFIGEL